MVWDGVLFGVWHSFYGPRFRRYDTLLKRCVEAHGASSSSPRLVTACECAEDYQMGHNALLQDPFTPRVGTIFSFQRRHWHSRIVLFPPFSADSRLRRPLSNLDPRQALSSAPLLALPLNLDLEKRQRPTRSSHLNQTRQNATAQPQLHPYSSTLLRNSDLTNCAFNQSLDSMSQQPLSSAVQPTDVYGGGELCTQASPQLPCSLPNAHCP